MSQIGCRMPSAFKLVSYWYFHKNCSSLLQGVSLAHSTITSVRDEYVWSIPALLQKNRTRLDHSSRSQIRTGDAKVCEKALFCFWSRFLKLSLYCLVLNSAKGVQKWQQPLLVSATVENFLSLLITKLTFSGTKLAKWGKYFWQTNALLGAKIAILLTLHVCLFAFSLYEKYDWTFHIGSSFQMSTIWQNQTFVSEARSIISLRKRKFL